MTMDVLENTRWNEWFLMAYVNVYMHGYLGKYLGDG